LAFAAGNVGEQATNIVPDRAEASLDAASLKVKIRKKSLHKSRHSFASRDSSSSITNPLSTNAGSICVNCQVMNDGGYRAFAHAHRLARFKGPWFASFRTQLSVKTVVAPMLGGSVPMYIFEDLGLPWIGVPIVNYDNHQHSADENLRLGNLWQGIEIYAALLAGLDW